MPVNNEIDSLLGKGGTIIFSIASFLVTTKKRMSVEGNFFSK